MSDTQSSREDAGPGEDSLRARLAAIGENGRVSADEVIFMRRQVFADGLVSSDELDAVFELAARAGDGDPEWPQFFAEIVADYYLREEEPQGYLTPEEFETLKARVLADKIASRLELTLLVKLMETAAATPDGMSAFVGEELKRSVLERPGGPKVDNALVGLFKRWLFASGGGGNVAVTRKEAEVVFDVNDALDQDDENAAWSALFVTAIVNHLMAHLGFEPVTREEAFRRRAWMNDHSVDVGGFLKRMATGGLAGFRALWTKEKSVYEETAERREAGVREAAQVMPEEAEWLAARIGADGAFSANEQRLIGEIRALGAPLPATLRALTERGDLGKADAA